MNVPASWKEVTIAQFTRAYEVLQTEYTEPLDREIALISAITGYSEESVMELSPKELIERVKQLSFLSDLTQINTKFPKWFAIKGKVFKVGIPKRISAGQYIDFMSFSKDPLKNMDKMLATVCLPMGIFGVKKYNGRTHSERSKLFYESLTMDIAYPIAIFFCNLWARFMPHIQTYLENQIPELEKILREMRSQISMDGYTPSIALQEEIRPNGTTTKI